MNFPNPKIPPDLPCHKEELSLFGDSHGSNLRTEALAQEGRPLGHGALCQIDELLNFCYTEFIGFYPPTQKTTGFTRG